MKNEVPMDYSFKHNEGDDEEDCIQAATLACFVGSKYGQKYAVTSEHVILSTDGNVYSKKPFLLKNRLGVCSSRGDKLMLDVGLITLDENIRHLCKNDLYDPKGCRRSWKILEGNHESVGDKNIFKCIPLDKRKSKNTLWETPITGKVASSNIHEQHLDILGNHCFLVASDDLVPFAVEGESGTLLAADMGDVDVYLIGIISGLFKRDCHQKFVICVFLSSALRCLSGNSHQQLTVCRSAEIGTFSADTDDIICGSTIFFKRVESVGKYDFRIEEQIVRLFNINFETDDCSAVELIYKSERQFRQKVFAREQIKDMAIYEPDRPEQVTLIYFYLTVQSLYAQSHKDAKRYLKEGIRCLSKVKQSQLRLLCKCVTYVTWLFIDTDKPIKLKTILKEGLKFFSENEDLPHFPKECLCYHYYDFSRYYVNMRKKEKAVSMAKLGYEYFRTLMNDSSEQESTECHRDLFNRYIFAVCQYVEALLWCGEHFEYVDEHVSEEALEAAACLIKSIEVNITEAPAVQRTLFYLAKCDLCFRKWDYENALQNAKLCLQIAKCHDLKEEQYSSGTRCVVLRKRIRSTSRL